MDGWSDVPADVRSQLSRVRPRLGEIGGCVYWLSSASSTNDVAARLAERGELEGTVVAADAQTAGRGRHGRVWVSPPGAGLYVSVILRPSTADTGSTFANPGGLITLASGVAIAEAVRLVTGLPAEIKWPNDVLIGRRKLAGVLAEAAAQAGMVQHVVLGFGLNLKTPACPPALESRLTSIEAETNRPADRALLLAEILAALAERCGDLRAGRFDAILSAWRRLAPSLPSAPIEWDSSAGVVRGCAQDIDDQGALLVRVGSRVERIVAGEIRWL